MDFNPGVRAKWIRALIRGKSVPMSIQFLPAAPRNNPNFLVQWKQLGGKHGDILLANTRIIRH